MSAALPIAAYTRISPAPPEMAALLAALADARGPRVGAALSFPPALAALDAKAQAVAEMEMRLAAIEPTNEFAGTINGDWETSRKAPGVNAPAPATLEEQS